MHQSVALRPSLLRSILRVAWRDIKILVRYPTWVISLCVWPVMFPLGYLFTYRALAGPQNEGLSSFVQLAGTSNYLAYVVSGTILWMWVNVMLWTFGGSLRNEQLRGTLESNWLAPVDKTFLLIGAALADAAQMMLFMCIAWVEFYLIYGVWWLGSPWHLGLVILASVPSVYGLGFVFAALVLWAKQIGVAVNLVRGTMLIFCGITYPIAVMPGWMVRVAEVIPLTHAIRATRAVMAGDGLGEIAADLWYLLLSGALLIAAGLLALRFIQQRIRCSGTLGHH